jgi:hypothetical protein
MLSDDIGLVMRAKGDEMTTSRFWVMPLLLGLLVMPVLLGCGTRASSSHVAGSIADAVAPLEQVTTGSATSVQLAWEAPTTNRDGTPLTDLAGYKLYYGHTPETYTSSINVGRRTTYTLTGLEAGKTYHFAVIAYDTSGNESAFSTEVQATLPSRPHNVPVLTQTSLVRGQYTRFRVAGLNPGEVVFFLFSMTGAGHGPCSPALGGLCIDLLGPQVFGEVTADALGSAILTAPIPADAPVGRTVVTQALIRRGRQGADSIKTNNVTGVVR